MSALTNRDRFEIFKRDAFTCQYCGRKAPDVVLNVDHIIPVSKGGSDDFENLITSCRECNSGKHARQLDTAMPRLSFTIEEKQQRLEQVQKYHAYMAEQEQAADRAVEMVLAHWAKLDGQDVEKGDYTYPEMLGNAARRFVTLLPLREILDAVDLTFAKFRDRYMSDSSGTKYFCGICWNKVRTADAVKAAVAEAKKEVSNVR